MEITLEGEVDTDSTTVQANQMLLSEVSTNETRIIQLSRTYVFLNFKYDIYPIRKS